jgi:hypothetical protein
MANFLIVHEEIRQKLILKTDYFPRVMSKAIKPYFRGDHFSGVNPPAVRRMPLATHSDSDLGTPNSVSTPLLGSYGQPKLLLS